MGQRGPAPSDPDDAEAGPLAAAPINSDRFLRPAVLGVRFRLHTEL